MSQASRKEKKQNNTSTYIAVLQKYVVSREARRTVRKGEYLVRIPVQTGAHAGHKVVTDGYLL